MDPRIIVSLPNHTALQGGAEEALGASYRQIDRHWKVRWIPAVVQLPVSFLAAIPDHDGGPCYRLDGASLLQEDG
jgi:hypothetical protein